ncbi:response regulator [Leptospira sp. WS92.C1]
MNPLQLDSNFLLMSAAGKLITWQFSDDFREFSDYLDRKTPPSQWNWTPANAWIAFENELKSEKKKTAVTRLKYIDTNGKTLDVQIRALASKKDHFLFLFAPQKTDPETPSLFLQDEKLRSVIFQNSANAILLLNPEDDTILENNQTALQYFEIKSSSEWIGKNFFSLLNNNFPNAEYEMIRKTILKGESFTGDVEFSTFQNKHFWGSVAFRILSSDQNRVVLVQIKNITEKINAERSLLEQSQKIAEHEANLNAIIENSEALIWSVNKNYEILIFNSKFKKVMKESYQYDIFPGFQIFQNNTNPETNKNWKAFYDRAFSGERFSINGTRPTRQNIVVFTETSFYPIRNSEGEITGVSAVSLDITDKKLAEEKFRLLFEYSSNPHILYDESGIFECNPATLTMLRCSDKNYILGKHPSFFSSETKPDGTIVRERSEKVETIALKRGSHTFERFYKRMDGEEFPIEITLTPLTIHHKTVFLAVWHEITERKVYEDSLKRAKDTAEAASKAKSDFLAMMSHEIRTPLNGVIGTVSLLEATSLNLEQKEYLDIIKTSGQNLLILLNDILDLSRIESGHLKLEMQPVSPERLIGDVINLFKAMAEEKGLEIESRISSLVPNWIISDPFRLRQIMINLLGNSVKFTEKGKIILSVEAEKFPNDKLRLIFRVQDTGIGIPEEKLEMLFKAFNQLDSSTTRRYGGSGLGLTISKKLAALMKGEIIVKSQVGRGSEFSLSILTEKLDYKIPAGVQELHSKNLAKIAVISIHDSGLKEQIKKFCERNGFQVKIVRTAREVIRVITEEERIGIFLTDLNLPDMNLPEILNEIRTANSSLKLTVILFMEKEFRTSYYLLTDGLFNRPGFKIFMMFKPVLLEELSKNFEKAFPTQVSKEQTLGNEKKLLSEKIPLKILLVEDNVINQKIAIRLLGKLGYSVDSAMNGVEALASLKNQWYDLIFMDIQMPEMDGYETTHHIRENFTNPKPIIVAMTANAMEGDKEKCIEAGMDAYIAKPIQITDIESSIIHLFQS